MSVDWTHTYSCHVYQPENLTSSVHDSGYGYFSSCQDRLLLLHESLFSIDIFFTVENTMSYHQELVLPKTHVTNSNTTSWSPISTKLSHMNVPYDIHPTIISQIIHYGRSLVANQDFNSDDPKIIPIIVTIEAKSEESAITETMLRRSLEGYAVNMVPASRVSIQRLEKIRVEEGDDLVVRKCVICLDEILSGSEVSRMPCLHNYHKDCIVSWLEKSNFCPLCRFQLPC